MNEGEIRSLTGLRGVAAWLVVFYHFRDVFLESYSGVELILSYGFYAVDLFFILSGFVVSLSAERYFYGSKISRVLVRFYSDRFSRIYPLHLVVLIVYLLNPIALTLFSETGVVPDRYDPLYYAASILLIQNWGLFDELKWNIPAWSISAEFAAYLIFPLLFYFVSLIRSRIYLMTLILFVLVFIAWVHKAFGIDSLGSDIARFGVVRCLLEFLLGVIVGRSYLSGYLNIGLRFGGWIQLLGLVVLVVLTLFAIPDYYFVPVILVLLIVSLINQESVMARILSSRFFWWMGVVSYSIYIVHYWVKDWVKFLSSEVGYAQFFVYVVSTFVIAYLMHKTIELPARGWLRRRLRGYYD